MARVTMETLLERLARDFPDVAFDGGELSEGYWISAKDKNGTWQWERARMTSASAAMYFAEAALTEFAGAQL